MTRNCIICSTNETSRWWSGPRCNKCALTEKRRANGIKIKVKKSKEEKKEYKAKWFKENYIPHPKTFKNSKAKDYKKQHRLNNIERYRENRKKWVKNNTNTHKESQKRYREKNKEILALKRSEWKKNNKGLVNHNTNLRRKHIKQRTPKWVNKKEIREIYKSCPEGYDVDHIIPLQGKTVCGLHVPWNLQHLPRSENRKKSNKL